MRNKLFTAAVNKQLANQYKYGSDLSKQKVVAKIFNPYGEGRWYLLNSDPNDPDYIWAIVTMYGNVEIGSVSRRELESLRLTPFRLPLERDIYFDPINAEEVFNGLVGGKFYAKGGEIKDDSYPSRFQKFIKELEKLSNDTGIAISDTGCIYDNYDNWVSYSNDWTSGDIIPNQGKTRYSKDAPKNWYKFIEELEDISNKNGVEVSITGGVSYNQKNVVYDKDWSSNDLRFTSDDIYAKGGEMAEGGEVNSFYEGQSIILSTDDAYFNRMTKEMKRFTMPFYNKELVIEKIIKDKPYNFAKAFVRETGVKVPFDIKLNERYVQQYAKGGEMAEGGEVSEWKKAVTIKRATKQEAEKNKNLLKEHYGKAGRNFKVEKRDNGWVVTYEFSMTDKMAKGGVAGYERLVKKVAKNYEGKNVPRKYQSEYGKTYNKEEAKEVGYKVATKVYGMPLAKMKK